MNPISKLIPSFIPLGGWILLAGIFALVGCSSGPRVNSLDDWNRAIYRKSAYQKYVAACQSPIRARTALETIYLGKPVEEGEGYAYYYRPQQFELAPAVLPVHPGCIWVSYTNSAGSGNTLGETATRIEYMCLIPYQNSTVVMEKEGNSEFRLACTVSSLVLPTARKEGQKLHVYGALTYWLNGRKWKECQCFQTEFHGRYTQWHENGAKRMQCQYVHNQRQGTATWWDKKGRTLAVGVYKDNLPWSGKFLTRYSGVNQYWGDRNDVVEITTYKDGIEQGTTREIIKAAETKPDQH